MSDKYQCESSGGHSVFNRQEDDQKTTHILKKVGLICKAAGLLSLQQSISCLWGVVAFVVGNSIQYNSLMQAVTTPAGKLLLFIHHLHTHSAITAQERALLKDMVVSADPAIFHAQDQYEQEGTELTLASHLKRLLQTASKMPPSVETHRRSESEGCRMKKSISVSIPERNIQKLTGIDNRI